MQQHDGTFTPRKLCLFAACLSSLALVAARPLDSPLLAECSYAMSQMMTSMHIASRGDPDADFAAMMIPHHEGAIAMARAELRYGRNEQLRRLAQEMIVTQQDEIAAMRMATRDASARDSSTTAPTGASR